MFGDLTTLSLAFANTTDVVGENNGTANVPNVSWLGHAQSRSYDVDLSQILTKNFIAGVNLNVITDQGFLANPYRSVRFLDTGNPKGYSLGSQVYPDTRTSTAVQIEGKYYLPYRAAVTGSYRYFRDTWSIVGNTYELDYTHPISNIWIVEGRFRYYKQNHADFYSDLFQYADEYRFEGRDQDLAAQDNYTIGAKVTYAFLPDGWKIFKRATATFDVSRITFHYVDFRNIKYLASRDTPRAMSPSTSSTPWCINSTCLCSSDGSDPATPPPQDHRGEGGDDTMVSATQSKSRGRGPRDRAPGHLR